MKSVKQWGLIILSVMFLQACNSNDDDPQTEVVTPEPPKTTIVDAAINDGNFTTLVAALQATGLDATLSDTNSKFTVFAPTDAAFALLGQETIDALLADTSTLSNILSYHVIASEVNATTAIGLAGTKVEMANGDSVGLSLAGDKLLVNTATVTATDIQTDNGIIHVIDAVLMPPQAMTTPTSNIVETAVANGNFTTLVTALQTAGLDTVLADENASFTVFAPTDAAFALINSATLTALLADSDALSKVLLQHVVMGSAVNSTTAYTLNGVMVDTASTARISVAINQATDSLTFGGANIVTKDIYTTNGIIHVIDAVILGEVALPSSSSSITDIAAANADFSTLVSALQSTGLDTVLADMNSQFTVFAPTNEAFAKLPAGTVESLTTEQLANILLYHVVPAKVLSDGAISLAQTSDNQVATANEQKVALSFAGSNLFTNGAKVSSANILAANGVIHVVDNVILPPATATTATQTIAEIAVADPDNFSTLVTALTAANLVDTLSSNDATFTVFAPTNAAFDKIDASALSALLADTDALSKLLLTHVVADVAIDSTSAFAANGKKLTTASGDMVEVSINAETGTLMINGAGIIIKDVYATNGIIHVIDTVIM